MTFKILSKNNVGVATLLLLTVLLSQSRILSFLIENTLGRALLILLLIFISYTNKILGVVSVLLIIIMLNNSDIGYMASGYMEGYTNSPETTISVTDVQAKKEEIVKKKEDIKAANEEDINKKKQDIKAKNEEGNSEKVTEAFEGYDFLGTERTLQKGKSSNSISVHSSIRDSEDISPFDKPTSLSFLSLF